MELGAFVSLEDISDALPSYEEEVLSVEMDVALGNAYKSLEEDIKAALEEHHGNQSVVSTGLNALMLIPTGRSSSALCTATQRIPTAASERGS
jgi:hypothetical protein